MPAGPTEDLPPFLAPMLCATGQPEWTEGWQLQAKFDAVVPLDMSALLRLGRAAARGAGERPRPLHEAVGGADAELEAPVVGLGVGEHLDAAEQLSDVADEDAGRAALERLGAVDVDRRLERLLAQVARAADDGGGAADAVLEVVGVADHLRVEADAGHDPNRSPAKRPTS